MSKKDEKQSGLNNEEFFSAIDQICEEKGLSKEKVMETIEAALAAAYKKDYGKKGQHIRAEFDPVTGTAEFYLVKEVVDETTREMPLDDKKEEDKKKGSSQKEKKEKSEKKNDKKEDEEERLPRFNLERDILLSEAQKIKKDVKLGDVLETKLETKSDYGRIAAQTAKQVIIQRIREAERNAMYEEYKEKEGEVVSGTVQRIEGRNVYIDLGKSIGVLFPVEQIPRENYRIGQRLKVYLAKVEADAKGPGITLSRSHPEMLRKLFELEVPEIFAGTVEIKAVAREAGERSKIAVIAKEEGIDPIGSCVGQKGTRVQTIIDELVGEKIDIIEWDDDPARFIASALSPAKVLAVDLDEENKHAIVKVPEDQLSLAIGKKGQNVRLAAKLTGWKIDVEGAGDLEKEDKDEQDEMNNNVEDNEKLKKETEKAEKKEEEESTGSKREEEKIEDKKAEEEIVKKA